MRMNQIALVTAVAAGVASNALAQQTPPVTSPVANQSPSPPSEPTRQWLVSGFAGTDFGRSAQESSANYGGTVGYLWNGKFGGEVALSVTPNFSFNPAAASVISGPPMVNTYMAHVVGATPFGPDRQWQPYVSGGVGAIQMRPDVFNVANDPSFGTTRVSDTRLGGDIGAGIMSFRGMVGFKADVRYFRATGTYNAGNGSSSSYSPTTSPSSIPSPTPSPTPNPMPGPYANPSAATAGVAATAPATVDAGSIAHTALTGLAFWRANVGLAFRW